MLLHGKRARIEGMTEYSPIGKDICECSAHWEGQQLTDYRFNHDRRVAEEKELVDTRHDDSPHYPQKPCSDGGDRHIWIIRVRDGRSDFWVWTFIFESKEIILVQIGVIKRGTGKFLEFEFGWSSWSSKGLEGTHDKIFICLYSCVNAIR